MVLDSYQQFYRAFETQPRTQVKAATVRSENTAKNPAAAWFAQYAPAFGIVPAGKETK